jgi:hypothetical protein
MLLFMAFAMVLALPATAMADTLEINNTLVVGSNVAKDPGQSGTGKVWLVAEDKGPADTRNGCNVDASHPVTVTFTSSDTSKIANPASVTLNDCGTGAAKDFSYSVASSATVGTVQISGAVSGGKSGTYTTTDTLAVTINAPAKQNTAVSNVSGGGAYGGNATLTSKLSSGSNNLSGKNVAFELNGQAVGTDATDANGVAELSGVSLSGINAGTHTGAVSANFTGDSGYNGSSGSGNLSVSKAATTTTVSCDAGPFTFNGSAQEPCSARATGPGGLDQPLTASYQGNTNAGQATASASYAGSGNYESSNGSKNFTIDARPITITADAKSKFFGDTDPALTYQRTSGTLVGDDQITGSLTRDSGEAPGQYSILQGSVSAGQNYAINYVGAKLTIGAWTTKGFYAPVDMLDSAGNIIVNTVKGGSTVPMKFELFKGATELKDVSAVKSTTYTKSAACNGAYADEIEVVTTGNTSLRFDATGDQFIYNWKTPTGAGCYKVTMTALDGSSLSAYFKTR